MSTARIKKNDTVIVDKGVSAGQTGKILRMFPKKGKAIVQGVNVIKKAVRRSEAHPNGGFIEREAPVQLSNLMPYDSDKKKGVRVKFVREGDKTVRKSKASGKSLD